MKKIFVSFVCCLLLLGGCGKNNELQDVSAKQLEKKIENKDSFVLIVSRESCTHCEDLKEMLSKTINDHATVIYKYEMDEASMDALIADAKWVQELLVEKNANSEYATPHVYYVYEGTVRDSFEGYDETQPNQFWDFIKNNSLENSK